MNPNHKYLIFDCNGFRRESATTKPAAIRKAHRLADSVGLHMQVCYSDRTPFGTQRHIVNVRSKANVTRQLDLHGHWHVKQ